MKKIAILLVVLLILPVGLAQEEEEKIIIGADHPFYGLKRFMEKFQMAMTSGEVMKAKLHLKFANKRVAEAKIAKKERSRNLALQGYDDEMSAALDSVEKSRGIGQNVSQIVKEINSSVEKHIAVLELVKAKVPEQAKIVIERNIERSREKVRIMEEKRAEKELIESMVGVSRQETVRDTHEQANEKAPKAEKNKSVNAQSDIIVGDVIKKIEKEYEKLNPAYETAKGKEKKA